MNSCYELVQSAPPQQPAIASPPPILEWGALLSVIAAGVGYVGKTLLQQWTHKEQSESELMRSLVQHSQHLLDLLIQDAKESKAEIIRHIDLKESVVKLSVQVDEKVTRALGGQSELYIESLRNQTKIIERIDALHSRGDQLEAVVQKIVKRDS